MLLSQGRRQTCILTALSRGVEIGPNLLQLLSGSAPLSAKIGVFSVARHPSAIASPVQRGLASQVRHGLRGNVLALRQLALARLATTLGVALANYSYSPGPSFFEVEPVQNSRTVAPISCHTAYHGQYCA